MSSRQKRSLEILIPQNIPLLDIEEYDTEDEIEEYSFKDFVRELENDNVIETLVKIDQPKGQYYLYPLIQDLHTHNFFQDEAEIFLLFDFLSSYDFQNQDIITLISTPEVQAIISAYKDFYDLNNIKSADDIIKLQTDKLDHKRPRKSPSSPSSIRDQGEQGISH